MDSETTLLSPNLKIDLLFRSNKDRILTKLANDCRRAKHLLLEQPEATLHQVVQHKVSSWELTVWKTTCSIKMGCGCRSDKAIRVGTLLGRFVTPRRTSGECVNPNSS